MSRCAVVGATSQRVCRPPRALATPRRIIARSGENALPGRAEGSDVALRSDRHGDVVGTELACSVLSQRFEGEIRVLLADLARLCRDHGTTQQQSRCARALHQLGTWPDPGTGGAPLAA